MPYIEIAFQEPLLKDPTRVRHVGDLNFLYSKLYIAVWIKQQGYKTIEFLCSIGLSHDSPQFITDLDNILLRRGFTATQLVRAKFLAFGEFMRRVGNNYEDKKIEENGDIYQGIPYATSIEVPPKVANTLNPGAARRGRKKNNG